MGSVNLQNFELTNEDKRLLEEYNNSIHNWELYHKLKKSEFEITNKLKFVNENKQEKIKNLFDSMMEDYGKLVEIEREYDEEFNYIRRY